MGDILFGSLAVAALFGGGLAGWVVGGLLSGERDYPWRRRHG